MTERESESGWGGAMVGFIFVLLTIVYGAYAGERFDAWRDDRADAEHERQDCEVACDLVGKRSMVHHEMGCTCLSK